MIMKCSLLSGYQHELHVVESPVCQYGFDYEGTKSLFVHCLLFSVELNDLLSKLLNLCTTAVTTELLLNFSIKYNAYDDLTKKLYFVSFIKSI